MRVKNAISEVIALVLGLAIGCAVALLVTTTGVGLVSGESHRPAIMSLNHGWKTAGIVTAAHHSNNTVAQLDNTPPHGRQHVHRGVSSATPPLETHGNQSMRTNILVLSLIVTVVRQSTSESR